MRDEVISKLLHKDMWKIENVRSNDNPNKYVLRSNMRGYTGGRYSITIIKLLRKVDKCRYRINVRWTPYNPDFEVLFYRFNTYEELKARLTILNPHLTDLTRSLTKE